MRTPTWKAATWSSTLAPSPDSLRLALESALVESPDDLATHRAYADLLMEQGDPRGELIQVQLALEEEGLSPAERQRLKVRELQLLAHEREWLGPLAPHLLDQPDHGNDFLLARGWLDIVELFELNRDVAEALAACPLARLLRDLIF